MNRRPKFWLHRSRSFWRGFAFLLFLLGTWLAAMFTDARVAWTSSNSRSSRAIRVDIGWGGIGGSWTESRYTARYMTSRFGATPPTSRWESSITKGKGARLAPEFRTTRLVNKFQTEDARFFFLPLWIPLPAWLLLWPWQMYRRDKKEDSLYGGSAPLPLEGD